MYYRLNFKFKLLFLEENPYNLHISNIIISSIINENAYIWVVICSLLNGVCTEEQVILA